MRYKVTHTTKYDYTEPASVCHNQLHLAPRESSVQQCEHFRLTVHPIPASKGRRADYYGNLVDYFSICETHRGMTVTATSRVAVVPRELPPSMTFPVWEEVAHQLLMVSSPAALDARQYTFPSPRVIPNSALAEYARRSFSPGRNILEAAGELTHRIFTQFQYDPHATTVHTPLEQIFQRRQGVCQDFAHVQIGCLRALGLAARYVSGYIRTYRADGRTRLIGADASHAWVSVYCGPVGWVDFDPTNDQIPVADHITVAWGRDYNDVCPIQGVFVGGGQHRMSVSVDVSPLE